MSDWIKQNCGVEIRRDHLKWYIKYPDGMILEKDCTVQELEILIHNQPMPTAYENQPLSFTIPGKPLTDNHAYWDQILKNKKTGELYVRRRLTPAGKKYKAIVEAKVREQVARLKPREYIVYIIVYAKWRTKGKGAKSPVEGSDVMRCEKLLIDSIYDTLMPDEYRSDKWIWIITLEKRHEPDKAKHRAVVTIRPWGDVERQGGLW